MIEVVAIDPAVFAELDRYWKLFVDQLGPSRGRLICKFPGSWKRLVFDSTSSSFRERAAFEELKKVLGSKAFVKRKDVPVEGTTWLEQALSEHRRDPFSLIIVTQEWAGAKEDSVNLCSALDIGDFEVPSSQTVPRTPQALAAVARDLLRYSARIRFIDPHFYPRKSRWKNSLAELLKGCVSKDVSKSFVEFHTMRDPKAPESGPVWEQSCGAIADVIPPKMELTVVRWDEDPERGEELHDRFILTELGGLTYGWGLDSRSPGGDSSRTTIARLDFDDAVARFAEFDRPSSHYRFVDEVTTQSNM